METQKARILVVDDEPMNIELISVLLADEYRIIVAKSGEEALRRAAGDPLPDLVLLDVLMPGMDGFEVCRRLKADPVTRRIPVIFITTLEAVQDEANGFALGAVDYIYKPFKPVILTSRIRTHLAMACQKRLLEQLVRERTAVLLNTQEALREAMGNLLTIRVAPGVFWLQVPEADLRILCGCPGEVVKLLMHKGLISPAIKDGKAFETGPNVILLSDLLVQNGRFANLAEFPVLQMLYRQGMILPDHPNNLGVKPMLMGSRDQVRAQMAYIHRGNYGLLSREEIMGAGVDERTADHMMRVKLKFAFGRIREPSEFLDTLEIDESPREIRNGVTVHRLEPNVFRFTHRGKSADIDLNLPKNVLYKSPYPLGFHRPDRHYFAVLHTGEGDGWNTECPSMGSVLMFQGRIYLIDAPPGIINSLTALGIDISEVEGIFHTHSHDDHFAGLPELIRTDRKLTYYAAPLVRKAVTKKFSALMSMPEEKFQAFFEIRDMEMDSWNKFGGLEVMPVYSPHPVETTLFLFRTLDQSGYRTYAHWADLSSFSVLDKMAGPGPLDVPESLIRTVKQQYLTHADLKKLDAGGDMIHGDARDFRSDPSQRLILAHKSTELTNEEMEIGSEASFGAVDILIPGTQDHLRQKAFIYLQRLFPEGSEDEIRMLVHGETTTHNAGTIIRRVSQDMDYVDMVAAGNVLYVNAASGVRNHLGFGSFLGLRRMFRRDVNDTGTYRAESHATTLRIYFPIFRSFLENNDLFNDLARRLEKIYFLRNTWLFGEQTSFAFLDRLSRSLRPVTVPDNEPVEPGRDALWLLQSGQVEMAETTGRRKQLLGPGDFFGEHNCLNGNRLNLGFRTREETILYRLPWTELPEAPIILWKVLEVNEKRSRRFSIL